MKITSVEAFLLSYPFPKPIRLEYYGGERTILKRDAMLVRITTDQGLVGYGPGPASERAKHAIDTVVAPFLLGHTPADPDAIRVLFLKQYEHDVELMKAYSAVEIALYDLVGKARRLPVSELLGGRVRDRILLYGSAGMYMPPEGYAQEAALAQSMGFRAYKMRPALGPERDLEAVRLMRNAVKPQFEIMVDAHTWWRMGDLSYPPQTVEDLARKLSEFDIAWLEEPMPPDNHEAYRRLKELDYVPLASGEHEPDDERYLDLITTESVDYVQMDIVCQGGFATGRRLFSEIATHGLRFAFHSWGTALEVIAAAQLGICWPQTVVEWLEYPCYSDGERRFMYEFPLASEMLREPLQIQSGSLVVPAKPGLGVEIDESVLQRYPWIPGPWSFFTLKSPAETWAVTSDHSIKWAGQQPAL